MVNVTIQQIKTAVWTKLHVGKALCFLCANTAHDAFYVSFCSTDISYIKFCSLRMNHLKVWRQGWPGHLLASLRISLTLIICHSGSLCFMPLDFYTPPFRYTCLYFKQAGQGIYLSRCTVRRTV